MVCADGQASGAGQADNCQDKAYVVVVEGHAVQTVRSSMQRTHQHLTKTSVKAWLNDVSRQQSLGVKGMTCVWQVRPARLYPCWLQHCAVRA